MSAASLTVTDPVLLDFAADVGTHGAVAVRGGGTRWDVGGRLADDCRLVHAPTGIADHVPDEMTVTVRAGTPVADLHAVLARAGQRTTLPERAGSTVGGALAVGQSDLHRRGRGPVRDALLQARYVSSEGRLVTAGGPTVKNVTGFDLCRLLVGSLGTLGLMGEVILRTRPVPPAARWLRGVGPPETLGCRTASAVLWDGEGAWIHLEGHGDDVAADATALGPGFEPADGPPPLPPHRWSVAPAAIAASVGDATGRFVAELGVGVVHAERPQPRRPRDPAVAALDDRVKASFDPTGRLAPGRRPGS